MATLPLGPAPVETASTLCLWGGGDQLLCDWWLCLHGGGLLASLPSGLCGGRVASMRQFAASQPCRGRAESSLPSLRWPELPGWGQPMSWQQCWQIVGRASWLCVVHVNETLPLPVASRCSGRCDCPCVGRSVLAALGPTAKAWCFLRAAPSTDPRARAGAICACHGCHGLLRLQQLHLRGLASVLWRLSGAGWEHGLRAGLCLGGAGSHR